MQTTTKKYFPLQLPFKICGFLDVGFPCLSIEFTYLKSHLSELLSSLLAQRGSDNRGCSVLVVAMCRRREGGGEKGG